MRVGTLESSSHGRDRLPGPLGAIPGLFAAGNTAAAPIGPAILSSEMSLGLAMTFGWLAGSAAATGDTDEH